MSGRAASDAMTVNVFVVVSFLAEVAMVVFAALAVFRIYAVNWWIILLNAWQLVFTGGFLLYLFNPRLGAETKLRNYMVLAITGAAILVIMHSVWQIVAEHSGTEEISAHNGSHLFQSYLGLASTRITLFVVITAAFINALFFRAPRK